MNKAHKVGIVHFGGQLAVATLPILMFLPDKKKWEETELGTKGYEIQTGTLTTRGFIHCKNGGVLTPSLGGLTPPSVESTGGTGGFNPPVRE